MKLKAKHIGFALLLHVFVVAAVYGTQDVTADTRTVTFNPNVQMRSLTRSVTPTRIKQSPPETPVKPPQPKLLKQSPGMSPYRTPGGPLRTRRI